LVSTFVLRKATKALPLCLAFFSANGVCRELYQEHQWLWFCEQSEVSNILTLSLLCSSVMPQHNCGCNRFQIIGLGEKS